MNNKVTSIKYCKWCGDPFEVKSPNQKYCSPSKKKCSKEASVKAGVTLHLNTEINIKIFYKLLKFIKPELVF